MVFWNFICTYIHTYLTWPRYNTVYYLYQMFGHDPFITWSLWQEKDLKINLLTVYRYVLVCKLGFYTCTYPYVFLTKKIKQLQVIALAQFLQFHTFNVFMTNSLLADGLRYRFTCICVHQMRNSLGTCFTFCKVYWS